LPPLKNIVNFAALCPGALTCDVVRYDLAPYIAIAVSEAQS